MGWHIIECAIPILILALVRTGRARSYIIRRHRDGRRLYRVVVLLLALVSIASVGGLMWHLATHLDHRPSEFLVVLLLVVVAILFALDRSKLVAEATATPKRVLAVGAHPDDLELACGGTLARLIDEGHEVHTVVMSRGEVGGDPDVRASEAKAGASLLGAATVTVHDFPDTNLELRPYG